MAAETRYPIPRGRIIIWTIGNSGELEQVIYDIDTPIGITAGALSPNGHFVVAAMQPAYQKADNPDPPFLMWDTASGASLKIADEPGNYKDNGQVKKLPAMQVQSIKFKSASELYMFSTPYDYTCGWSSKFRLKKNLKENGASSEIIIKEIRTWKFVVPEVTFEFLDPLSLRLYLLT